MKMISKTHTAASAAFMVALLTPTLAFADPDTTLGGVTGFATTILNFMTGPIATTVAAIAIALVGYRWFSGRMEMARAATTMAGIVLVVGAVQIVSWIRAGGTGFDEPAAPSTPAPAPKSTALLVSPSMEATFERRMALGFTI